MKEYPIRDYGEFNVFRKFLRELSEVILNVTTSLRKHEDSAPKNLSKVIIYIRLKNHYTPLSLAVRGARLLYSQIASKILLGIKDVNIKSVGGLSGN